MDQHENFIPAVMSRTTCDNHGADVHEPCYEIVMEERYTNINPLDRQLFAIFGEKPPTHKRLPGVCNNRARRAGMVGKISPKSLMMREENTTSRPANRRSKQRTNR